MLEDGKPHKVRIAVSGTTIIIMVLLITGLLCYWKKHPTYVSKMLASCHTTGKRTKENKKAILVDNILNTIQQELNSNIQGAPTDRPHGQVSPPSPPDIQM